MTVTFPIIKSKISAIKFENKDIINVIKALDMMMQL